MKALFSFLTGRKALFQQCLQEAIPNLDRLVADPAETLAQGDITIGPERNYLWPTLLTLLLVIPLWIVSLLAIFLCFPAPGLGPVNWSLVATAPAVICTFFLLARWFRGGPCVLSKTGVAFTLRRKTILCPWALFDTPGRPVPLMMVQRPPDVLAVLPLQSQRCVHAVLPVSPQAVSLVEARKDDVVIAQGTEASTWQFKFRSAHEVELRGFAVAADELGGLLLHLGRALAGRRNQESAGGSEASLAATMDENGWLTIRISRVTFPPVCCACGVATATTQAFRGYMPFRHQLARGQVDLTLPIPVCGACQIAGKRRYRKAFWKTYLTVFVTGLIGGFSTGVLIAFAIGKPFLTGGFIFLFLGGLVSLFSGWFIARKAAQKAALPVQLKHFLPNEGTIALRFRRPEYAEQILAPNEGSSHRLTSSG